YLDNSTRHQRREITMKRLDNQSGSLGVGGANMGIIAPTHHDLEIAVRSTAQKALKDGTARALKYKGVAQTKKDRALVEGFQKLPEKERYSVSLPGDADREFSAGIVNDRIVVAEYGQVPGLALGYFDAGIQPRF